MLLEGFSEGLGLFCGTLEGFHKHGGFWMGEGIRMPVSVDFPCLSQPGKAVGRALPVRILVMELLWEGQLKAVVCP